ncbi:MAG: TPM domain-containing protein [Clostridiaceae bacterium]|nr:TPM domain-containing protein [Clostridiaceae bacterium]
MTNKRKMIGLWLLISILLMISLGSVYGISILQTPIQDIYIQDYAGILSTEVKKDMLNMSRVLQEKTTAELVVVTIPTLEGRSVEEYVVHLFREWGIGDINENNGALLLIAEEERETRIEVGYGLEGTLNDGKVGAILDKMIPYFQRGDYSAGVSTAYSLLVQEIATEYDIDSNEIFTAGNVITPITLDEGITFFQMFLLMVTTIFTLLILMAIASLVTRRNMFKVANGFLGDLLSGKYAGPTSGPPVVRGHGRNSYRNRHYRSGGFGGGSFGSKSSRRGGGFGGGFGGGSSGGGGASRKW